MQKKLLLFFFIVSFLGSNAQITTIGIPYYFEHDFPKQISVYETPEFDAEILLEEDQSEMLLKPYRFAKVFPVNIDFKKISTNIENDSINIWVLKIKSSNAKSIALLFSNFKLPKQANLYIYDINKTHLIGSITDNNNKENLILPTAYIPADEIVIEYSETKNSDFKANFFLTQISHDYRGLLDKDSQECEVNINCNEGDDWQIVKHAVCKFTYNSGGSSYLCSGALVANTQLSNVPYFLTANHCVATTEEASSSVFYFNYEASSCSGTTGLTTNTISGSTLIATANGGLDFSLLEMSLIPPESYLPYYAGWSRNTSAPSQTTCIHHPAGDIKKISIDYNVATTGSFPGYEDNKHWQISDWELGTTEGGSSGSPLFNEYKLIIGDLSGGEASCTYNYNDYFQKFNHSWDDFSEHNKQLKHWLDPNSENPISLNGYSPYINFDLEPPKKLTYQFVNETSVKLSWYPPDFSNSNYEDDFENYNDFSLDIDNWTQYDLDDGETWSSSEFDFFNEAYTGSFIVFTPSACEPANPLGWEAHSGNKFIACFSSISEASPNNDWLISKQLTIENDEQLSFFAKSLTDKYGLERFKVAISTTGNNVDDFSYISGTSYIEAPTNWTQYTYDLSSYIGKEIYIAINVVSNDAFCFMLDNFEVSQNNSITSKEEHIGYKLYKNNSLFKELNKVTSYIDNSIDTGTYYYHITALYTNDEESRQSEQINVNIGADVSETKALDLSIFPNPSNGIFTIISADNIDSLQIKIYNYEGKIMGVFEDNFSQIIKLDLSNYPNGIYLIQFIIDEELFSRKIFIEK